MAMQQHLQDHSIRSGSGMSSRRGSSERMRQQQLLLHHSLRLLQLVLVLTLA
jgi:hypothetical protein